MRVKKYISFGLVILILFTSCSNSLLEGLTDFTSALNNNLFIDSALTASELEKLNSAVNTNLITEVDSNNKLKIISNVPISSYNDTEISVTLTLPTKLKDNDVAVLAPLSSSVLDSLLLLSDNKKKAEQFAIYMKAPLSKEEDIKACMNTMVDLLDSFSRLPEELQTPLDGLKKFFTNFSAAPTRGDALALQVVATSLTNIFAQISAGYATMKDEIVYEITLDPTNTNWSKEDLEKLFNPLEPFLYSFIDTLARELAVMNAILPNCGSSINFDLFKIIEGVLNGK